MAQINFTVFFIYILPVIVGLLLGLSLWKLKKTYILSVLLILLDIVFWYILSNINTHGSEGAGILVTMYTLTAIAFTLIEIIKLVIRRYVK